MAKGIKLDKPAIQPHDDGVYPRCVWCFGEIYGPAVIDYSKGLIGCGAVNGCGKKVPESYIKLTPTKENDRV